MMADRKGIERRDGHRARVAPVVAAAMSTLTGCAHGPAATNGFATANRRETAMNSRPLMTVRIAAAPAQKLGTVPPRRSQCLAGHWRRLSGPATLREGSAWRRRLGGA